MPNVRYYDYGVMRREADRRMYDAQKRAAEPVPTKRVTHDYSEQKRPEPEPVPACAQDAPEPERPACPEPGEICTQPTPPSVAIGSEELLILALLMVALSEKGSLPLALALLYLLMG